ncbi:DUF221-domain-containing protein [Gautieria morchelliformis]|nr:DUF221-domain-containing protein [Gautieria morchelliformis]
MGLEVTVVGDHCVGSAGFPSPCLLPIHSVYLGFLYTFFLGFPSTFVRSTMSETNGSVADQVGSLLTQANQRTIGPAGVASNLALWSGVTLGTALVFNILRPRNKIVYQPKIKYHVGDKQPPQISNGLFSWIPPLIHSKEPYLLDKIGLDAVVFLRFLRLLRWLFLAVAILTCAVLIPINVSYNLAHVSQDRRDILSMLTIRDVQGNVLFAHIAAEYVITGLVMFLVFINWRTMVRLRHMYYRSPEYTQSFYARTLIVHRVPKALQSDQGLKSLFASLSIPYPATSVHIARRVGRLPELIKYHNDAVRDLEAVLVRYLKDGKADHKRPTVTVGGFLGMGGTKKDAIDFYTNRIRNAERSIQEAREQIAASQGKAERYGFASMAAVPYAHIVAYMLRNKHPKGTRIESAPNPKDIIWENLNASDATLARKKTLGWVWLCVVAFFNTVPLLAISALANLNALAHFVPFLSRVANNHVALFALVSGVAPPSVAAIFGYFFPMIMRWLSKYQGAATKSRLDRAVIARYFAFMIISQLFIFTLIGVLFSAGQQIAAQIGKTSFQQILDNLDVLPSSINSTYINQSSYWLTFFPLRGFLAVFDLAQIINLVWIYFRKWVFGRTPRDIREWTQPPDFEYAVYYVNMLFMAAVGLIFAPLAPLVAAMACIVFWISSLVYKYQLMFVFVTHVESGGRLWNVVVNRLLVSVVLMQCLMTLTMGLQLGWRTFEWVATIPPIIFIIFFKAYLSRTFSSQYRYYVPSESDVANSKVHSERADNRGQRLANRFGHPALHADLFTPMLHARMMPLLPQVYHGRLATQETKLNEYGGEKIEAQVTPSGVKIASVDQRDLEYDPALYQRDRGELDWDQRSLSSTTYLGDGTASLDASKSGFFAHEGRSSPAPQPAGYNQYMTGGPGMQLEQLPLLQNTDSRPTISRQESTTSLPVYAQHVQYPSSPVGRMSPSQVQYPPAPVHRASPSDGYREAPTHRPYPSQGTYPPQSYRGQSSDQGPSGNMAGRRADGAGFH